MSKTSKKSKKQSSTKAPCAYLRQYVSLDKLRKMCEALEIAFDKKDDIEDLCHLIKQKRPDLMRGRGWNMLRTAFNFLDFTSEKGLLALKRYATNILGAKVGLPGLYNTLEVYTWLRGDPKAAIGYAKYALQRDAARKILGNDPRKFHKKSMRKSIRKRV